MPEGSGECDCSVWCEIQGRGYGGPQHTFTDVCSHDAVHNMVAVSNVLTSSQFCEVIKQGR
jgi:hypothetical protein